MNSIACNIVLLPDETIAEHAIALSAQLQPHDAYFALDTQAGPFPHATLYMTQLKVSDLGEACTHLAAVASTMSPVDLHPKGYFQKWGYIDVDCERSDAFVAAQQAVLAAINPIRDGMRAKDQVRLQAATGEERQNLETYGYQGIGELFRPHITLTRFTDEAPIDTAHFPPISEFRGQFVKLGLFEMGDNGTCVREIARFALGTTQDS